MNTKTLVKRMIPILPRKLIYCDVGARWGIGEPWKLFNNLLQIISFEPDDEEYKLLKTNLRANDILFQNALYKDLSEISLNLTKSRGCSSIYSSNIDFLKNYPDEKRFLIEKSIKISPTTLDELSLQKKIGAIDFIKLDVQGAELDILKGGKGLLEEQIIGIEVEIEFSQLYKNQPLFADVDSYIRQSFNLQLHDIRKTYWKYKQGINIGASKGQLIFGDALYFIPPQKIISWCQKFNSKEAVNKILMACLIGIVYGYLDYSLCILSQPKINKIMKNEIINIWKSIILSYGRSKKNSWKGSFKISHLFHLLYRLFQPTHEGWASTGHHLGSKKKFGVFE